MKVAINAGQGEIVDVIAPTMNSGNDVFDMSAPAANHPDADGKIRKQSQRAR